MTEKEPPPGEKDAETMGADDPYDLKGVLKRLGGSQSDHWNKVLIDQTVHTLGLNRCDGEARERRHRAALAGLIGIGPQDEMEGMIAAQLIATHNATMECYRRAMIAEQTLEGRRENLNQANKLARTYATLIEFVLGRGLHREISRLLTFQNTVDVASRTLKNIRDVAAIGQQAICGRGGSGIPA